MTKTELRKVYKAKREQLTAFEYHKLNQQLLGQFINIDFQLVKYIHFYLPIVKNFEPDTSGLIFWLKTNYPEIKIVYAKTNFDTLSIELYLDNPALIIDLSPRGIPEPVKGDMANAALIDMVVVPLLCFDRRGYRVGYGMGFYDRYMARCKPSARFIGLSFYEPVANIADINQFDIRLNQCITPAKIWNFDA